MGYRGTAVKIKLGEFGLLTDSSGDKLPPGALVDAKNVFLVNGTVQKAPGTQTYNASPLPAPIVSIHDYWPTTVQQRLFAVTSTGSIYRDIGGRDFIGGTAIRTGLGNLSANCEFVEGGQESGGKQKKLFFFSYGVSQLQVLAGDGTSFGNVTFPSTDWIAANYPKTGVLFRGRLWAFAGQIAYGSDTADHTNFASNYLAIAVFPGEGGEVRGCFVYKTKLFAFKDGGFVYTLNDSDNSSTNWYWQKVSSNFGIASPNAVDESIDTLILGNATGTLSTYVPSQKTGGFEADDLLKQLQIRQYFTANTDRSGAYVQHCLYYPDKKLFFATYRTGYNTANDQLYVLDFNQQMPRVTTWPKGTPNCLALRKDANLILRPMYGDASGYVHLMDWETRTEGGAAYSGSFQTAHLDFGFLDPYGTQGISAKEKHFDWLAVHYVPEGSHLLSCDFFVDGRYVDSCTFPMDQYLNNELDATSEDNLGTIRTGEANTETVIRKLRGTGRTLSVKLYNAGSNQSFQVSAITVGFRLGAEKVQR